MDGVTLYGSPKNREAREQGKVRNGSLGKSRREYQIHSGKIETGISNSLRENRDGNIKNTTR
jgi:hypothetical protein